MKYCFDTSAFIQPWKNRFPPDLFMPLWLKLEELIRSGDIFASKAVLDDLKRVDDEVFRWARSQRGLFIEIDQDQMREMRDILRVYPRLVEEGGRRSASDPFVVALAKTENACLITYEEANPSSSRTNIPSVCRSLGIEHKDLMGVIRDKQWRFGLIE